MTKNQYTLAQLIQGLEVTLKGDANCVISGVSPIQQSQSGHISFLNNPLYRKYLVDTKASAVILSPEEAEACPVNAIVTTNPYYVYSQIARFFDLQSAKQSGIHASAVIGKDCHIAESVSVGANVVIADNVTLASGVSIAANCSIGQGVIIGENSQLDANVIIYHGVKIGKRARIMSGAVIGGDGFGFANKAGQWHKVPQLGSVNIGDDVDVGANTTIDRGALEDTIIEDGVKLDNLVQIGHNVRIGAHTVIAGCVGVAGSTTIGKYCMIGGAACFAGHISVADKVIVTGMTAVTKSITEPGMYSSGIVGAIPTMEFRKNNARFHRLGQLMDKVKALEASVKELLNTK